VILPRSKRLIGQGRATLVVLLGVWLVGCSDLADGPPVSKAEQASLPTAKYALPEGLCPAKYIPDRLAEKWRRQSLGEYEALRRALRTHPDHVVTATAVLSDPEPGESRQVREQLTVAQLAETHLHEFEDYGDPEAMRINRDVEGGEAIDCRLRMKKELERLLEQAD
jgi:hypothetical protein